ncbi:hypothetical protein COS81_00565 [candidate division WWE3 bacterium CG06_land_8_20_14_3_00_42_16]|uniref:Uncharacterized protein n=4 Tax=Katanobacteria TaxID=422282 RepID=A0A2M7API3_UNCKA|nr:MAG: hypothetical protein AUJ38_00795 [bacterium CG1_02_42_9]PIU69292.1 MAG: hypothetical protein COS81_00565 [candidate division WWE3 bacterium CG06_land_8_20_14_3_00_42_16]PIZ43295.1 MAG: hypothetical protein COY34_01175 [candidate division WWE3 bacterium CG_4_10_14_0_2_um_filter_42_8]PJA37313.1 MAG: hypothetical protein CO181_04005 [candidate division WWE3 bacterium CG_4_9_14_3_um_filter_43_9]PJC68132.1 MAG: hypothetical protein CO015_05120 [candidate division WWE3 bacterium CG_4_8_14_3_u
MNTDINPNPRLKKLFEVFSEEQKIRPVPSREPALKVSRATSLVAFLYEKFRSALEYQEEHLLRRWAIERILRRRLTFKSSSENLAYMLIRELIWSRYLHLKDVTEEMIEKTDRVLQKYFSILEQRKNYHLKTQSSATVFDWIISLASTEIDGQLVSSKKTGAILEFTYSWFNPRFEIEWIKKEDKEILLFIAILRALLKSDRATLRYNLLKLYYPSWEKNDPSIIAEVAKSFDALMRTIEHYIKHPLNDKLLNTIKRQVAPFFILQGFVEKYAEKAQTIIQNPLQLERVFKEIIETKYREIKVKVDRGITRSIIYVFLTKMVIALLFEFPYDLYLAKILNFRPLIINLFFPPTLMFIVGLLIKTPGESNTSLLLKKLKEIIYSSSQDQLDNITQIKKPRFPKLSSLIFPVLYLATFFVSFGLICLILLKLKFSLVSTAVFLFFLCVVSFFSYRISNSAHELILEESKEKVYTFLIDFFSLPILWAGRWLSLTFVRFNFVIFILDFLIETPLKTMIGIGEDWLNFLKEKKKELV